MEHVQDNTINKIKLLFVLDKMEIPLTETNILDICTSIEMCSTNSDRFTYIDLKEAMYQLKEVGFIFENKTENDEPIYSITFEGRECLSHFHYRIPKDIRDRITIYAQENRLHLKRSQEYLSEYSKNEDGSYTVTLKIKDPSTSTGSLMVLRLKVSNRKMALETAQKWTNKAPQIYENIYDNLLDN